MLIRVNKTTNQVDSSLIIPQLEGFEDIELQDGFEWIDINSEWYRKYEMDSLKLVENKISYFSQLAFDERAKVLPEYKLINASLGVYDATETERIKGIVEAFRTEYYRLEALCKQAKSVEELELIQANYEIQ